MVFALAYSMCLGIEGNHLISLFNHPGCIVAKISGCRFKPVYDEDLFEPPVFQR